MQIFRQISMLASIALATGGCGLGPARTPEIWDRVADVDATYHLEVQVKHAIYCELRESVVEIRKRLGNNKYEYKERDVTTVEDMYLPDSWGILVQMSLQADEKSSLTPSVTFKDPVDNALTGFRIGAASVAQSFSTGVGGTFSSQNSRTNKYNFYYAIRDLAYPILSGSNCRRRPPELGDVNSTSSPFLDASQLDIRDWLYSAVRVIDYRRTSRASEAAVGPPLGPASGATQSDTSTYTNKFTIVTSANASATWNLIKIGTASAPFFDTSRSRVHELIMTVGPGALPRSKERLRDPAVASEPSPAVVSAQFAAQIGSAVANSLR